MYGRSVLATLNSTPSRPALAMRLTALLPPPPTPTTLIRAPVRPSSSSLSRSIEAVSEPVIVCLASAMRPSLQEFLEQRSQPSGDASERAGANRPGRLHHLIPVRVHHEPDCRRIGRTVDVIRESPDAGWTSAADRQIEDLLGDLRHALEHRPAAGQDDPGVQRPVEPRAP